VNASPVIVEDEVVVGGNCGVYEGTVVRRRAVLGAGVILNPSIPVIDAETGHEVARGVVPPWSVVINATRPKEFAGGTFGLPCALIIKRLGEGERHDKTALNDVLREHGVAT
jgi:2,3,4,5-tetrahydropyridine-2-carboxylate N-succinyltransferase